MKRKKTDEMNYSSIAQKILEAAGGPDNVEGATHCMTRLRLVFKDLERVDKSAIGDLEGVLHTAEVGSQFQIVFGGNIKEVYNEFNRLLSPEIGKNKEPFRFSLRQTIRSIFTEKK